ncbi:MAG: hypothetical protein Q4C91_17790 [Eubacteriales bacterium]|nr:hypothetical protein [Eubacteriales bacterium]
MEETSENKPIKHRKHISAGLVAHVQASRGALPGKRADISAQLKKVNY